MGSKKEKLKRNCTPRYTIEEVSKYFEDRDCVLLSTEYKNNRTNLDYICKCGNKSQITLDGLKQGKLCRNCGYERSTNKLRFNIRYIKEEFAKEDYTLLSTEYKNNKTKLEYICGCGNQSQITWNMFSRGSRCIKCGNSKISGKLKLDFTYIKNGFEKEGCVLLSTEYINSVTPLDYICSCGETSQITWGNFQQGTRCMVCGHIKTTTKRRLDFEFVKNEFKRGGCTLLSTEYINSYTPLNYICSCGNQAHIRRGNFSQGARCSICSVKRSRGERKINKILNSKMINYISEYRVNGCRDERTVPFDFAIKNNNSIIGLIEYDGKQHFKPIDFFGGESSFKKTQRHDQIKTEYCIKNDIPLLRIPYTKFNSIQNIVPDFLTSIGVI